MKKKERQKRKFSKIIILFLSFILLFTGVVLANDEGLTTSKDVWINVKITNNGAPSGNGNSHKIYACRDSRAVNYNDTGRHRQALCIYPEEEKEIILKDQINIDLDKVEDALYIIKKIPKIDTEVDQKYIIPSINFDEKVVLAYKESNIRLFLNFDKNKIFQNELINTKITLSTNSQQNIDLSKYVIDAYLIIEDENGEIIEKQDLFDLKKGIDFLDLLKINNLNSGLDIKGFKQFTTVKKPGNYKMELTITLSSDFLNTEIDSNYIYQIDVKSNKIPFTILEKDEIDYFLEIGDIVQMTKKETKEAAAATVGVGSLGWLLLLWRKKRLVEVVTTFIQNNEILIESLKAGELKSLRELQKYTRPKMWQMVRNEKISKILKEVLENIAKK